MLLSNPRLTSAVVSLRDFLGNSDRAGVEYSNGGSAKWMMSSNFDEVSMELLLIVVVGGGGGMVDNFPEPEVVAAPTSAASAPVGAAADERCCCCPRAEARRNN